MLTQCSHAVSPWLITTYYHSHRRLVSVQEMVCDTIVPFPHAILFTHTPSLTLCKHHSLTSATMPGPPSLSSFSDFESIITNTSHASGECPFCPLAPPSPVDIKPRHCQCCHRLLRKFSIGGVVAVAQALFHLATSHPCNVGQTMVANGSTTVHVIYPTVSHFSD